MHLPHLALWQLPLPSPHQPLVQLQHFRDFSLILEAIFIPLSLQNPLHTLKAHHPDLGSLKALNLGGFYALGLETCPLFTFCWPLPCPISPQNQLQSLKDLYLILESDSPPLTLPCSNCPQPSAPRMS